MREIKFRAWDKIGKRMVRVVSINFDNAIVTCKILDKGKMSTCFNSDFKDVELIQFTGLKDKNGKEIYEGDIVRYGDGGTEERFQIRLVYFKDGSFLVDDDVYFSGNLSPIILNCFACESKEYENVCEVIGNIYENPELLDASSQKEVQEEEK